MWPKPRGMRLTSDGAHTTQDAGEHGLRFAAGEAPAAAMPALSVRDLRKSYGVVEALCGVSFAVAPGEIFGLLGANGAGKTTLIDVVATHRRPCSGTAEVFGRDVIGDAAAVRAMVGLVPQELALYPELTVVENLWFFGRMFDVAGTTLSARVAELLQLFGLDARAGDRVRTLSTGLQRRLNFAVSLVHHPRLLLLDEPTVGIDPRAREQIFAVVRSLRTAGAAIVYTTHQLEEAEALCDRVAIVDEGRLIAIGRVDQLLATTPDADLSLHSLFLRLTDKELRQ